MGSGEYRWGGGIGIGIAPVSTMVAPLNNAERDEYYWRHVNSSMNAVSFGFVATAILISMFLIMAIFEKIFRPRSSSSSSSSLPSRNRLDLEAQMVYGGKHDFPSPKVKPSYLFFLCFSLYLGSRHVTLCIRERLVFISLCLFVALFCLSFFFFFFFFCLLFLQMTVYARGVSVLMPGEEIPTFIAHPAPVPCPPEQITWPTHQHNTCFGPSSTANSTRNQM
ncbi:hypothetical protein FEM48_Zijuj04G0073600 [Ziziphus jujuba var. spinosa]|uniref:Uncharacterized protein n=1 Tax=Ziziphus jujuba var. spinosa TaxID=714518 RepID=A0A978VIK1_ZIZJJ|nr:hypothetical protein FEM48_Zijuj04G0073600 [Ziziphus jujuba var. spinosa]